MLNITSNRPKIEQSHPNQFDDCIVPSGRDPGHVEAADTFIGAGIILSGRI